MTSTPARFEEADAALACELPAAPYPGLRPFEKDEWPIFFGRERMCDDVIARLVEQGLVVVHGDSGCGKSSLIYAGVLPTLEQQAARGGMRWITCAAFPGDDPLQNLASSLVRLGKTDVATDPDRLIAVRRVLNFGRDGGVALADIVRRDPTLHMCILIDQFEELFAHAKRGGALEARLLVEFLIGIQEQRPDGIYVILTMRSEFLGSCAKFAGFAEAVNSAQYLLPRMERADLLRAIREVATLFDGTITRELAERLIDDTGGTQDQLPLIQHGLMLLHRKYVSHDSASELPRWKLGIEHYDRSTGGLASLLSDHANEVADAVEPRAVKSGAVKPSAGYDASVVPPGESRLVEDLFRALTDINAEGHAIRRPQTLRQLLAITRIDEGRLREIINAFRAPGVSLLRPYGTERIALDDRVDIGHEALIRCWKRIADPQDGWLIREFKNGLVWRSLLVQVDSFERDPSNVLSPTTTRERVKWLERRNPDWCQRYGGGWERVKKLVDASVVQLEALEQEQQNSMVATAEAAIQTRSARRLRLGILFVLALAVFAFIERENAILAQEHAGQETKRAELEKKRTDEALVKVTRALDRAFDEAGRATAANSRFEEMTEVLNTATTALQSLPKAVKTQQVKQALSEAKVVLPEEPRDLPKSKLAPRVYLQLSDARQRESVVQLTRQLGQVMINGAPVSAIPPVGVQRAKLNSLRCFRKSECSEAKELLVEVNQLLVSPKLVLQDFSDGFENAKGMRSRHYEIWFAPGEVQLTQ